MKVKAIIAGALVAIIALCALGIGIGMNNVEEKLPTNVTEAYQMGGEHLSGRLEVLGYEPGTPVVTPAEEYTPQSFAPTNSFVEEGETVYYGWKCDRTEPVVEEPEKPQRPTFGCPHGYINPAFCWKCRA